MSLKIPFLVDSTALTDMDYFDWLSEYKIWGGLKQLVPVS